MNARAAMAARVVGLLIVGAGVLDPAITTARPVRSTVAVVVVDSTQRVLGDRVALAIDDRFDVVRAPLPGAAATVLVGSRLPDDVAWSEWSAPLFAVIPSRPSGRPLVTMAAAMVPRRSAVAARVPVDVTVRVSGARGRVVDVRLDAGGLSVDHVTLRPASDDTLIQVPLSFVPTATGVAPLHVVAVVDGTDSAAVDLATEVRDPRWPVLVFDARPSWQSTFVRRAIERDPRFVVTSRIITSRAISTDAGQPPASLDEPLSLDRFDVVVVGAPEALTESQVRTLERFLRRGGSAVLLFDHHESGAYERLVGVRRWETARVDESIPVTRRSADTVAMRASTIVWPAALPTGASVIALSAGSPRSPAERPVIWRTAVGAGRLVVSGALDSWRFRDDSTTTFDAFWRALLAETAMSVSPPVTVELEQGAIGPGDSTRVHVTVRDAAVADPLGGPRHATVSVTVEGGLSTDTIRLWPDLAPGSFTGVVPAQRSVGVRRVVASSAGTRGDASLAVVPIASRPAPDDPALVRQWATANRGRAITEGDLQTLTAAIDQSLDVPPRPTTWYPMRSGWWIMPLALALGAEWWSRRRRGLR